MSGIFALKSWFDNRMNPILVKECRQAVQSRLIISVLILFVTINLAIIGGYLLLTEDAGTAPTGGRGVFLFLFGVLCVTCLGIIPVYTAYRMAKEHDAIDSDLYFITTLTPAAIVRGKYLGAMAVVLLIFSVCAPFMVLTYLLRGVDLAGAVLTLAGLFMASAGMNMLALCLASFNKILRALLIIPAINFIFTPIVSGTAMASRFMETGVPGGLFDWEILGPGLALLGLELAALLVVYAYAVAMLSPKTSNRMVFPRTAITLCWIATGLLALACDHYSHRSDQFLLDWAYVSVVVLLIHLAMVLGERDTWTARVRRRIPRNPLLRPLAFLFYSGSAGGTLWYGLLFVTSLLIGGAIATSPIGSFRADHLEQFYNMTLIAGYVFCYGMTAVVLRRLLFRHMATPILPLIAVLVGIFCYFPPMIAAFIFAKHFESALPWYLVASPLHLTGPTHPATEAAKVLLVVWCVGATVIAVPWVLRQWRRFLPWEGASSTAETTSPFASDSPAASDASGASFSLEPAAE